MTSKFHELQIRPGTLEDVADVVALDRASVLLPHWAANEYAAAVEPMESAPTGVSRGLFVAENAGVLTGFSVVRIARIAEEVVAELESVAVGASFQSRGLGKALCLRAIEWARQQGAGAMGLEVRSRNEAAIALYDGLGFAYEGTRPRYYRDPPDDALLLRLGLV